jgi:hypothetical protein
MGAVLAAALMWNFNPIPAPMPMPNPKPVFTNTDLHGTWMFEWGQISDVGFIKFQEDGTYFYKHDPLGEYAHVGRWELTNDVLTMWDYSWNQTQGTFADHGQHCIGLRQKGWGQIEGSGWANIRLTERR